MIKIVASSTGVDFSHYKQNTLHRRIARRMVLLKVDGLREYVKLLEHNPPEVEALYHDILINVTSFFRNPEAFEVLKTRVFPRLTENRSRHDPLRVWVLGCSTGEEAYSVAIAFAEYEEQSGRHVPLQVFATDLDAASIEVARAGVYSKHVAQDVSPARLRRFFTDVDGHYRIAKSIRDVCIFARHNVLNAPPFSNIDLLSCRNLLIYLEPVLQQAVVPIMHYALRTDGCLWLGCSETIGSYRDLFWLEDGKHKFYRRKPLPVRMPSGFPIAERGGARREAGPSLASVREASISAANEVQKEAERLLMARFLPPSVLVNSDFEVLHFRGDTSPYLKQPTGKPNLNLLKLLREGLLVPVQAALREADEGGVPIRKPSLRVRSGSSLLELGVEVIPVRNEPGRQGCFLVLFDEAGADGAAAPSAPEPVEAPADEQETLRVKQELAATREYLQSVIEQQEAANEELQSANEEVQSANEELQSINEELETSKEEIQSTNEELATVNDELQNRNLELSQTNNDLVNLFSSVQMAIVMLGPDLRIRRFTPMAEKLLNLIAADVGRPIADIKLSIDVPDLEGVLLDVMDTVSSLEREVRDRQGRCYSLRVRPYRTLDNRIDGAVMVLVDVDAMKRIEESLERVQAELLVAGRDKDRFLAMLAHELRNPLAPLRNVGAVLKTGEMDKATVTWSSEVLERQIHTMTRMIDDLLDASRVTQGKVQLRQEYVDLTEVLNRLMTQALMKLGERRQRLTSKLPARALPVWGDPVRLEQIFGNLLNNASKFSPEGSEIVVGGRIVEDPDAHGAPGASRVIVSVQDSGIGLSPEMLEHAFDLFVQGDASLARVHGGLGIGLTIARQLASLHRGTVRASSPGIGQGATFEVDLPLYAGSRPEAAPEVAPGPKLGRPRRVLVVDDNLDGAESVLRLVRSRGHVVEQAHDAEHALAAAATLNPEVVLLDIGLPRIDGFELARLLRARQGDETLFLIAVSGYGQDADRQHSSEAGFDAHLVKPVEPGVLLELVERAPSSVAEGGP